MVKEELCKKLVEVVRICNRVMAVILASYKDGVEVDIWVCSSKWKKFGRESFF